MYIYRTFVLTLKVSKRFTANLVKFEVNLLLQAVWNLNELEKWNLQNSALWHPLLMNADQHVTK